MSYYFVLDDVLIGMKFDPNDAAQNFHLVWKLCDPIRIWKEQNLKLPIWYESFVYEQCVQLSNFKFEILYSTKNVTYFRGGPLIGHLIQIMRDQIELHEKNGSLSSNRRLFAYFAHDSTLSAVLHQLNMFNGYVNFI